jgi:hypothetical protein
MKPKLEMTAEVTYRVHYQKLEDFLAQVYAMKEFDFLLATGLTGGNCPEYVVTGSFSETAWNLQRQVKRIRQGCKSKNVPLILNVLAVDGYIPTGKYVVDTRPKVPPLRQYRALLQVTGNPDHPSCLAIKKANKHDKQFIERATSLDLICLEQRGPKCE